MAEQYLKVRKNKSIKIEEIYLNMNIDKKYFYIKIYKNKNK